MTRQQKKFCEEYIVDANAKAAAVRAGYSANSHSAVRRLMENEEVRQCISRLTREVEDEKAAATQEVIGFLTAVMRGDIEEIKSSAKDRLHAAELLGKRYGIFEGTDSEEENPTVVISGERDLE